MIGFACGHMVEQLYRTDFDNPVTRIRVEAGRFRIHHDFTHLLPL